MNQEDVFVTLFVRLRPAPDFAGADLEATISTWQQAQERLGPTGRPIALTTSRGKRYAVSIDAREVIDYLARVAEHERLTDEDAFLVFERRFRGGEHPFRAQLELIDHTGNAPLRIVSRAMQHLFLGMNLAHPGSCNLLFSHYVGIDDDVWPAPCLSGGPLETALLHAKEIGWPGLGPIAFADVWDWLERTRVVDAAVAIDPVHKALFALLSVCDEATGEPETLLIVMQALEALLVVGHQGVRSLVRSRLEAILGAPTDDAHWFARLYELRCRIAHGGMTVARPGVVLDIGEDEALEGHHAKLWRPVDESIALLIALLQDLVKSSAAGYEFGQAVARTPFRAPIV